jgi:hypothetical protein
MVIVISTMILATIGGCQRSEVLPAAISFDHIILDRHGPIAPWGKAAGDINGDGRPDMIVGGHDGGGLVWYENPNWRKHMIAPEGKFSTDHEVADIDKDGRNDVVSLMSDRLVWYRNNGGDRWTMNEIDRQRLLDIEIVDLDGT